VESRGEVAAVKAREVSENVQNICILSQKMDVFCLKRWMYFVSKDGCILRKRSI